MWRIHRSCSLQTTSGKGEDVSFISDLLQDEFGQGRADVCICSTLTHDAMIDLENSDSALATRLVRFGISKQETAERLSLILVSLA